MLGASNTSYFLPSLPLSETRPVNLRYGPVTGGPASDTPPSFTHSPSASVLSMVTGCICTEGTEKIPSLPPLANHCIPGGCIDLLPPCNPSLPGVRQRDRNVRVPIGLLTPSIEPERFYIFPDHRLDSSRAVSTSISPDWSRQVRREIVHPDIIKRSDDLSA